MKRYTITCEKNTVAADHGVISTRLNVEEDKQGEWVRYDPELQKQIDEVAADNALLRVAAGRAENIEKHRDELVEALREAENKLRYAREERDEAIAERNAHENDAASLIYRGNSVSYIYDKMLAYRNQVGEAVGDILKIDEIIFAAGAPLGSDNYFAIREITSKRQRERAGEKAK